MSVTHGTVSGYQYFRCRCPACRAAWAEYTWRRAHGGPRDPAACSHVWDDSHRGRYRCIRCEKVVTDERTELTGPDDAVAGQVG